MKAFSDDKMYLAYWLFQTISEFDWVENIEVQGENSGYKHFLLFVPTMFSKGVCFDDH